MNSHFVAIPNLAVQDENNLYKSLKRHNLIYVMWAIQKSAQIDDNYYFTIDLLLRFGEQSVSKDNIQAVKDTLIILENNNLIFNMDSNNSPLQTATKNTFLCYSVNWFETHEEYGTNKNWFKLYDSDVINIVTKSNTSRGTHHYLLTTFCNIISRMNSDSNIEEDSYSYPSYKRIEYDTGFGKSRIEVYIKSLEAINALHYMNSGDWCKVDKCKTGNNYYCRNISNWKELLESIIAQDKQNMISKGWSLTKFNKTNSNSLIEIDEDDDTWS